MELLSNCIAKLIKIPSLNDFQTACLCKLYENKDVFVFFLKIAESQWVTKVF